MPSLLITSSKSLVCFFAVRNMKVAVVGGGISGLICAYELAKAGVKVVIYEKEHYIGRTVTVDDVDIDLGFIFLNWVSYKYF